MDLRYRIYRTLRNGSCPFERITKFVPEEGRILDLGCGFGVFSLFLARDSARRSITGIDCEQARIRIAEEYSREATINNCIFLQGDILENNYSGIYDCILLVDVLYQLTPEEKAKVIKKCRESLSEGGLLIVKEMDNKPFWKFIWCCFQESVIARLARLNKKRIVFLGATEMSGIISGAGFSVDMSRIDKGYPYPHILFICRKQGT